jgi:hypothetical protein
MADKITRIIENKRAAISQPFQLVQPDNPASVNFAKVLCAYYKDYIPPTESCMEPVAYWLYPIIDEDIISDMEDFNGVKGMIVQDFFWRNLIKDMLPPESRGIRIVFSNDCTESAFTYQINGPNAVYVSKLLQWLFD